MARTILASLISLLAIFLVMDGPQSLGLLIYDEQFAIIILGAALALCFIAGETSHIQRLILCGLALATFVFAWRYPVLSQEFYSHPFEVQLIGAIFVALTFIGLYRTNGMGLVLVLAIFLGYALIADLIPGTLQGRGQAIHELVGYLVVDSTAMLGSPLMIIATIVVLYIFFGALLARSGGSNWFTDISIALVGHSRGGPAKVAVISSALFGSISGSAVANVASTGVITIPMMKESGLTARQAGAFEAAASTGGQVMPPVMGAAGFLMAEFLQVSYGEVIKAAAVPALLFFFSVLLQAHWLSAPPTLAHAERQLSGRSLRQVLRSGWYFTIPFAVLIFSLFGLNQSAGKAAIWASLALILLGSFWSYGGKKLRPIDVWESLVATGEVAISIILVGAMAGMVIGVLEVTGLSFSLTFLLVQLGQMNPLILLGLTAVVCIILGMGMPTSGIYLLVVMLAAPPLIQIGFEPIAVHLFILYFGLMSMISPPVAVAAFTAASIAGSKPMETALTAVQLSWPAFIVPFLFVYNPGLLFVEGIGIGIWTMMGAAVGIVGVSMALAARRPKNQRMLAMTIGSLALWLIATAV